MSASLVLHIAGVSKTYGGLRPLRIDELRVSAGDRVALLGLDQAMAEVLVNLITGAAVPDQGALTVFGRPTTAIAGAEEWLAVVDRFGIVSERAVLLEGLTAIQNLSLPFTVEIEPPSAEVRARASALAREAGLSEAEWDAPVGALAALSRTRLRIARAIALDPAILVLEHPTATVGPEEGPVLARLVASIAARRKLTIVAITADRAFGEALGARTLTLDPASGRLADRRGWFGLRGR